MVVPMMNPLLRMLMVAGACTGLAGCSQPASQPGSAEYGAADARPAVPSRARLCIAEGQPGAVVPTSPEHDVWAITVSSEGAPCAHTREWGDVHQVAYDVVRAPRHGRITQEARDGRMEVSYWPARGFVGSDSFALRYPPRNVALPYLVGVVP